MSDIFEFNNKKETFGEVLRNYHWKVFFDKIPNVDKTGAELMGANVGGKAVAEDVTYLATERP